MAVLYYLGMKTILFALMVLVAFATAEEFIFNSGEHNPKCDRVTYDTFTHEFKPSECTIFIKCRLLNVSQFSSDAEVEIFRPQGSYLSVNIFDRDKSKTLSLAEFSVLVSSGALCLCRFQDSADLYKAK